MRLAAYVRVSTKGQADDGLGRVDQERHIRSWAKRHGHSLCGQVAFDQAPGTTPVDQRAGFVDVLGRIAAGRCEGLIVLNLGRIARTLTVQEAALAMVWATGERVFTVDTGEVLQDDPDDPMRTAIRQVMGVFHQLDRAMIVARLKGGRQVKAEQGGYAYGAPGFGQRAEEKAWWLMRPSRPPSPGYGSYGPLGRPYGPSRPPWTLRAVLPSGATTGTRRPSPGCWSALFQRKPERLGRGVTQGVR